LKANIFLFFMGTAGAGKTTLTAAFRSWMQTEGYDTVTINMDPGATDLLYSPDIDIRDWVKLEEVMDEYHLGPNGAQITSSDLAYSHTPDIKNAVEGFRTDYFLVDTPGQIELFAYREAARNFILALTGGQSAAIYLFEPFLARTPAGMVSQIALATSVKYRLELPFIQVLNKIDLLEPGDMERIKRWENPETLYNDLIRETGSMVNEMGVEIFRALERTGDAPELIPCSARTMEGIDDIYATVQTIFMGGEDIDRE